MPSLLPRSRGVWRLAPNSNLSAGLGRASAPSENAAGRGSSCSPPMECPSANCLGGGKERVARGDVVRGSSPMGPMG